MANFEEYVASLALRVRESLQVSPQKSAVAQSTAVARFSDFVISDASGVNATLRGEGQVWPSAVPLAFIVERICTRIQDELDILVQL